jgi:catechol 2,3-dioxygenase-like lactoylglutathione lyase family enzyme
MLGQQPLVAFVATAKPDQAQAFYADTLGLRLQQRDAFALVFDAGGTPLRVAIVDAFQPQPFTVLGWIVQDVAEVARQLMARGVSFKRFDGMDQDELGIWHAPGGASIAWFADPDGNTLSITQL